MQGITYKEVLRLPEQERILTKEHLALASRSKDKRMA